MGQQSPSRLISPKLIESLRSALYVAVLTGAGVSAESNIPMFREAQTGLWSKYRPEELVTPQAFRRNPKLVWEQYTWRRELIAQAKPNPGHLALAELEQRVPKFTLITQNVGGLHQRVGSRNVIELHGNITHTKCFDEDIIDSRQRLTSRHAVLVAVAISGQMSAGLVKRSLQRLCVLLLTLPYEALRRGATVVEINPDETPLTPHVTFALPGSGGQILPELLRQ